MTIPSLTFVRISTPGGPYRAGDLVSIAFDEPTVGRLLSHGLAGAEGSALRAALAGPADTMIPETVSAIVLVSSPPYETGEAVTLSFVDPAVARIHSTGPKGRSADASSDVARAPGTARDATSEAPTNGTLHAIASQLPHEATASPTLLRPPHAPLQGVDDLADTQPSASLEPTASATPVTLTAVPSSRMTSAREEALPGVATLASPLGNEELAATESMPARLERATSAEGTPLEAAPSFVRADAAVRSAVAAQATPVRAEPAGTVSREAEHRYTSSSGVRPADPLPHDTTSPLAAPKVASSTVATAADAAPEAAVRRLTISHDAVLPVMIQADANPAFECADVVVEDARVPRFGRFAGQAGSETRSADRRLMIGADSAASNEVPKIGYDQVLPGVRGITSPRSDRHEARHSGIDYVIRLDWPTERAGRFVQVVDKLFTVDRLGWYRHVLATRLLIADDLVRRADGSREWSSHPRAVASLRLVRSAALEALGAPLLAAYLPGFSVSRDWLATLDHQALPSALVALCDDVAGDLSNVVDEPAGERGALFGAISHESFVAPHRSGTSIEAMLPRLVPTVATDPSLSEALRRYRETLLELFAQIAPAPSAVRVRQMAQPNAVLDDRLWQVACAVQQSLVSTEAASGA